MYKINTVGEGGGLNYMNPPHEQPMCATVPTFDNSRFWAKTNLFEPLDGNVEKKMFFFFFAIK